MSKPWSNQGVDGARKFLNRVWTFFTEPDNIIEGEGGALERIYHKSVKKITEDFEKLAFNTAISQMMIFVNAVYKEGKCPKAYAEGFVKMLSCISPHIGEELWNILGHDNTIAYEPWPTYDAAKTIDDCLQMPVQINGKVRSIVDVPNGADKDTVLAIVKDDDKIKQALDGKIIVKEIVVPGKIINIVVK